MIRQVCVDGLRVALLIMVPVICCGPSPARADEAAEIVKQYPDLLEGITSFGAAVAGDWLYTYGGHKGEPHQYSIENQSNQLRRLNLKEPGQWETVATGPRLQGLAMVAHGGKLYRVGGFTAYNKKGEDQDLRSVADVARFDPETRKWQELPSMPLARSSFDAVVMGDALYLAGGWAMGPAGKKWHDTSFACDLSQAKLRWVELPKQPFQRRANSLGEFDGKLYVIGGIGPDGQPSTAVDVFDPQAHKWSKGPNLIGNGMGGFGCSAFEVGGTLYVSTFGGLLQRLTGDGKEWGIARKLNEKRFFHRMLPLNNHQLIMVGGTSPQAGKNVKLRVIELRQ
ncbi:MAG: hypothetical protein CMJ64_22170 [Planctomycetaceae bacterium]|nr:hypothetical protein [Planctomycetaceae bacterium]